jgi:hypothetical protein
MFISMIFSEYHNLYIFLYTQYSMYSFVTLLADKKVDVIN